VNFRALIAPIIDFLFPSACFTCETQLTESSKFICSECLAKGLRPGEEDGWLLEKKFTQSGLIDSIFAVYYFDQEGVIQNIIHLFKYKKKFRLAYKMGELIGNELLNSNDHYYDLIMPVPLHRLRMIDRGYNQSYYLAKGIAAVLGITASDKYLKRIRHTDSQSLLNFHERRTNVEGAFCAVKVGGISGKNIMIVDDVITTGATINECAKELKRCGAKTIGAVSLAIARPPVTSSPAL
jgi:ComF family protein